MQLAKLWQILTRRRAAAEIRDAIRADMARPGFHGDPNAEWSSEIAASREDRAS